MTNKKIKSIRQIEGKVATLKRALSKKEIIENFGVQEQGVLYVFIGDIYEYPYLDRIRINTITGNFANWCSSYTKK